MNLFAEYDNVFPLLAPVDIASTVTAAPYVALKHAHKLAFLVSFGAINTGSADTEVVTVECATAEGGTEAAVAFRYRSVAAGSNQWGAVTTADTTGISSDSDASGTQYWIEVDPDELASSDYTVARVKFTDATDMAACLVAAYALITPRYKQTTNISSTASASS
jgi:hypothetical protein